MFLFSSSWNQIKMFETLQFFVWLFIFVLDELLIWTINSSCTKGDNGLVGGRTRHHCHTFLTFSSCVTKKNLFVWWLHPTLDTIKIWYLTRINLFCVFLVGNFSNKRNHEIEEKMFTIIIVLNKHLLYNPWCPMQIQFYLMYIIFMQIHQPYHRITLENQITF